MFFLFSLRTNSSWFEFYALEYTLTVTTGIAYSFRHKSINFNGVSSYSPVFETIYKDKTDPFSPHISIFSILGLLKTLSVDFLSFV